MPLEQMTRQCLSHKDVATPGGGNSPKSRLSVLSRATRPTSIRNEHRQLICSKYSRETAGRKPRPHA